MCVLKLFGKFISFELRTWEPFFRRFSRRKVQQLRWPCVGQQKERMLSLLPSSHRHDSKPLKYRGTTGKHEQDKWTSVIVHIRKDRIWRPFYWPNWDHLQEWSSQEYSWCVFVKAKDVYVHHSMWKVVVYPGLCNIPPSVLITYFRQLLHNEGFQCRKPYLGGLIQIQ